MRGLRRLGPYPPFASVGFCFFLDVAGGYSSVVLSLEQDVLTGMEQLPELLAQDVQLGRKGGIWP